MLGSFVVSTGSGGAPMGPSSGGHMVLNSVFGMKGDRGCFGSPIGRCDELWRVGLVLLLGVLITFLEDLLPSTLPRPSPSRLPHNTSVEYFLFKVGMAFEDWLAAAE